MGPWKEFEKKKLLKFRNQIFKIQFCLLNLQGRCIKIGVSWPSSRQFLQFSGDDSYYGGNDHVTKVNSFWMWRVLAASNYLWLYSPKKLTWNFKDKTYRIFQNLCGLPSPEEIRSKIQTDVYKYQFIYTFILQGLQGPLASLCLNNVQSSQNAIIYYRKMCSRKF